jgi:hypothetical protein
MGPGDENGAGMVQFTANITALAAHFGCLVVTVHHVGHSEKQRLRGHSSLIGGLDVTVLFERNEGELSTVLTVMKLKDEEAGSKFTMRLKREVIAVDENGEEVSTLVVDAVTPGAVEGAKAKAGKSIPASMRLLVSMVISSKRDTSSFDDLFTKLSNPSIAW